MGRDIIAGMEIFTATHDDIPDWAIYVTPAFRVLGNNELSFIGWNPEKEKRNDPQGLFL